MTTPYKTCSCGRVFATRDDYERKTTFLNVQYLEGYAPPLELRNCACGSTLAEPIPFALNERAWAEREAA